MSNERVYNDEAAKTIVSFLKAHVPRSDIQNIETALKNEFVLAKKKGKKLRHKPNKKKTQYLTRREKKCLGFYNIPRNSLKYEDILPMNKIWNEYIEEIIELDNNIPNFTNKNWESFTQSLYKADFHGCIISVVRSKCPSYVGKTGICIMDTRNTFKILSIDNIVVTIPKRQSVFEIHLHNLKITLFGKLMCARPAERSTKKLKGHLHPDLD